MKILNRWTDAIIFEDDKPELRDTILAAIAAKTYLGGANLGGANLGGANLGGANLGGANLGGAHLRGAYLGGARIAWESHDLVAELLRRAAGDDIDKRKLAGLILISRDWCWHQFLNLDDPLKDWALSVLAEYVQPEDGAPEVLRELPERNKVD